MADAMEVQLADAIVTELNAVAQSTWAVQGWEAERTWSPWDETPDVRDTPRVHVLPMTCPMSQRESRAGPWSFEYGIAIDVQQLVPLGNGVVDKATCDLLTRLCEQLHDFYRDEHVILTDGSRKWVVWTAERPQLFVAERLWTEHVFESFLELTIRGCR